MNLQGQLSSSYLLRDILDDIVGSLLQTSSEENIFLSQPGCDNVLHLLKLIQELLVNQIGIKLLVNFKAYFYETENNLFYTHISILFFFIYSFHLLALQTNLHPMTNGN